MTQDVESKNEVPSVTNAAAGVAPAGRLLNLNDLRIDCGVGERSQEFLAEGAPISLYALAISGLIAVVVVFGFIEMTAPTRLASGVTMSDLARRFKGNVPKNKVPLAPKGQRIKRTVLPAPRLVKELESASVQLDSPNIPHEKPSYLRQVDLIERIVRTYGAGVVDARDLAGSIVLASHRQNYDPILVTAVIKAESAFNPTALSEKGARGLMQLMPKTAEWVANSNGVPRKTLYDPSFNIRLGIAYLKDLEEGYNGNLLFTLVAYNWGPGHVQSAAEGKRRLPRECMKYALSILRDYNQWKKGQI
jgi:soluble lytic murein transglycosylase-like protein